MNFTVCELRVIINLLRTKAPAGRTSEDALFHTSFTHSLSVWSQASGNTAVNAAHSRGVGTLMWPGDQRPPGRVTFQGDFRHEQELAS